MNSTDSANEVLFDADCKHGNTDHKEYKRRRFGGDDDVCRWQGWPYKLSCGWEEIIGCSKETKLVSWATITHNLA
jgi:hypothetical protein